MLRWLSAPLFLLGCHSALAANLLDVYRSALVNDPVLGAAKQNYEARKEVLPQARSALLPNVTTGYYTAWNERSYPGATITDTDPDSPTFGQTFSIPDDEFNENAWQTQLQQPLFDGPAFFTYRGSKSRLAQAGFDYLGAEQLLIVRVTQAYLDILRAQAQVDSTQAEEEAVKRQLEQVQQRFDVGLVAITDVLEARAAYDAAAVRRIQAEGDQSIFFETLTTLTGSRYSQVDRLDESLPITNPEPTDQEEWVTTALSNNPSVLGARKQVDAAREDVRARQAGHLPFVDGTVTYNEFDTGGRTFLANETHTTIYRLNLSLPIYQGGFTQSRVREARSRLLQSEEILRDTEWSVKRDTYNLLRAVATDVVRVAARIRAIKSAESALEATQTGYEVGTRNIVDVLQAQQRLYASQFDYADSRYRYVNDLLFLLQTAGTLAEESVERLAAFSDAANPVLRIDKLSAYTPAEGNGAN
jgi:outer membrane protein